MGDISGVELVVDEAALTTALRRLTPLVGEIDAALAEIGAIVGDLGHDCSGHRTGVAFTAAQSGLARLTGAQLQAVRSSTITFIDNLTRAVSEFREVEATAATELRTGQC